MKKIFLLSSLLFIGFQGKSQEEMIFNRCATTEYINYREQLQPGYIQATNEAFDIALQSQQGEMPKSNEKYTIPVVVHIVYNNEAQNLPDSVVHDAMRVINEDFNRLNADSVNLRSEFHPYIGYGNIEFRLANYDPDGNPTNGITRTQTNLSTFTDPLGVLNGDMSSLERVKATEDGGISPWDQNRYLNIWVCNMAINLMGSEIPVLLGYATPPSNLPNWPPGSTTGMNDGVVIQYQALGSNNPNQIVMQDTEVVVKGRTVTHEIGHYLGLRHIWADGDCTEEDGIADTPNADNSSDSDCNKTKNTCVDAIDGIDLPDMVENFMDYSAEDCQNTFTKGQINLMRGVLENQRWDLVNENGAVHIKKEELAEITLYPNPSHSQITIVSNKKIQGDILILDLNGKVVQSRSANNFKTVVDIENLEGGIYHITVKGQTGVKKLVKL